MLGLVILAVILAVGSGAGYLFAKYKTVAAVEAELKALEVAAVVDAKAVIAKVRAAL